MTAYDPAAMALLGVSPEEIDPQKAAAVAAATDAEFPNTAKMSASRPYAETILKFLAHCANRNIVLVNRSLARSTGAGDALTADDVTPLLDEFFGIDRDALLREKRRMVDDMHRMIGEMGLDEEVALALAEQIDTTAKRMGVLP